MTLDPLQRQERQRRSDPQDPGARLAELQLRARVEGADVFLEALLDRETWNRSGEALQDAAIQEAVRRLAPAFQHLDTRVYKRRDDAHRLASFRHVKTGAELILIPGGAFSMGEAGDSNEGPVHPCRIKRPFLIGRFPLLQAEWDRPGFILYDQRSWEDPALPMEGVSWVDAQVWLKHVGDGLRLPSEAEWEYAARAASTTRYFWSGTMDRSFCWFADNSDERPHAPSEHADRHNAFGLVDVLGNILEYCQDRWAEDDASGPEDQEPRDSGPPKPRVVRGASWFDNAIDCRVSYRHWREMGDRSDDVGLRLARSLL